MRKVQRGGQRSDGRLLRLPRHAAVSLLVAVLAALQLGDFFMAGDEFIWVIGTVAAFVVAAWVSLRRCTQRRSRARAHPHSTAVGAAAAALVLAPGLARWIASHSSNPYTVGDDQVIVRLEPRFQCCSPCWCNGGWCGGDGCA